MMMKPATESCVPPGFRFHPTDEELVGYYLRKKVAAQKIDLDVIKDIDLYRIEPWDLPEKCRIGYEEEKEWYFFSHKDKKYPTGTRTNRATIAGFWKATGRDKAVYDQKSKVIGMRKTLVFYGGRAPNGHKSDWIMHEYRLESEENGPLQEEGWVVCRAFKKRATGQAKTCTESWGTSQYIFNESTTNNSLMNNPNDSCMQAVPWQHHHHNLLTQNFLCKQEADNLTINNFVINSDSFVHLPPLHDEIIPSLPPSSERHVFSDGGGKNKVTDWRSLDKFVASQLSHVDHDDDENGDDLNSGMRSVLVRPEEYFWNSISDCDLGISVFHN